MGGAALSVLHISASDNAGGSARAGYRLHEGLKRLGIGSRMLVGWRVTEDTDVKLVGDHRLWILDRLAGRVADRLSLQYLWVPSSLAIPLRTWFREADVLQLGNLHGGYFSHTVLPRLSRQRPIVWRLDDMWAMTGHCAYDFGCGRWAGGCGSCPILSDYPALRHDRTALLWRVKRRVYRRSRLTLVTPSRWLADLTRRSPLLQNHPVQVIPYGLDTDVFRPMPQAAAREVLGLDPSRRVILFGAHFATERRKGGHVLLEALARLSAEARASTELLVIGRESDRLRTALPLPARWLGSVTDDRLLAGIYAASDVFVLPTLADNLPLGVMEAMACGVPVVSSDVGGVRELVRHGETGWLTPAGDGAALAAGLETVLRDSELRARMGAQARAIVEAEHTLARQARQYLELYRSLVPSGRAGLSHA
jgi:glycosyltransferase involved in cell wall biosynthesis